MAPAPVLHFGRSSPFDPDERETLRAVLAAVAASGHAEREGMVELLRATLARVDALGAALAEWPPVFQETALGDRRRGPATLVDLLATATDANVDMFLPTQALVGRALLMAEMNAWRLASHIAEQALGGRGGGAQALREQVDRWLHGCVHTKLAEEVLESICIDAVMERRIRDRAVADLTRIWENRLTYRVRDFFPLLEATWSARRRIRVSVGTLLGVSEMFRLIQGGCDPRFMDYFSRPRLTRDEREAFQEFLIGVPTEHIHSLEQYMAQTGRSSLAPEEAAHVAYARTRRKAGSHPGVEAYEFFRERHLQAAARRVKNLPGPKRTAEEYVMIYYLDASSAEREPPTAAAPA